MARAVHKFIPLGGSVLGQWIGMLPASADELAIDVVTVKINGSRWTSTFQRKVADLQDTQLPKGELVAVQFRSAKKAWLIEAAGNGAATIADVTPGGFSLPRDDVRHVCRTCIRDLEAFRQRALRRRSAIRDRGKSLSSWRRMVARSRRQPLVGGPVSSSKHRSLPDLTRFLRFPLTTDGNARRRKARRVAYQGPTYWPLGRESLSGQPDKREIYDDATRFLSGKFGPKTVAYRLVAAYFGCSDENIRKLAAPRR